MFNNERLHIDRQVLKSEATHVDSLGDCRVGGLVAIAGVGVEVAGKGEVKSEKEGIKRLLKLLGTPNGLPPNGLRRQCTKS